MTPAAVAESAFSFFFGWGAPVRDPTGGCAIDSPPTCRRLHKTLSLNSPRPPNEATCQPEINWIFHTRIQVSLSAGKPNRKVTLFTTTIKSCAATRPVPPTRQPPSVPTQTGSHCSRFNNKIIKSFKIFGHHYNE